MGQRIYPLVLCFFCLLGIVPAWGATIYVTSSADSGPGTLREAAAYSNTATGVQTIEIITGAQIFIVNTIDFQSPVIIEGNQNTISSNGYTILRLMTGSNGSIIRNLVLIGADYSSSHAGIRIDSDRNTVTGCVIGTDWSGQSGQGNYRGIFLYYADDNYIGGINTSGNVISGNNSSGIYLDNSHRNFIAGNTIGLTPGKDTPRPNYAGVDLYYSDYNQIGLPQTNYYNVISANSYYGLRIGYGSNLNSVQNNFIGINEYSSTFTGQDYGVYISGDNNLIGRDAAGGRNIISGNMSCEVYVTSDSNTITLNFIGTNVAGDQVISGYASTKIYLYHADRNIIGFKEQGYGNVIFGGTYGIRTDYDANYNSWYGNTIKHFSNKGIDSYYGYYPPTITHAHTNHMWGRSSSNYYIEVFKAPDANGGSELFLGFTYADSRGDWSISVTGISEGDYVTALATGTSGYNNNTSEFSSPLRVDNSTSPPIPPTPTPTPDYKVQVGNIKAFNNIIRRNGNNYLPCELRWQQPRDAATTVRILNENGRLVRILTSNRWYAKCQVHALNWDSRDTNGNLVASGLYYAHVQSEDLNHFVKILVTDR